jgi:hypothetical protein
LINGRYQFIEECLTKMKSVPPKKNTNYLMHNINYQHIYKHMSTGIKDYLLPIIYGKQFLVQNIEMKYYLVGCAIHEVSRIY